MTSRLQEIFRANRLRSVYGSWFHTKNGRTVLNDRFWAAWLSGNLRVYYDECASNFRCASLPPTTSNMISSEDLVDNVGMALVDAAKVIPGFPTREIQVDRVWRLIELMKLVPWSEAFSMVRPAWE